MNDAIRGKVEEFMNSLEADDYHEGANWHGYTVYVPDYDKSTYIGLPYIVLVKGNEVRLSTPEESLEYLDVE